MKRGLALIVVIGVLGVLAVLALAFVAMAQLERRASEQRVNAARAYLLARSGIEDALARLSAGQDPAAPENHYLGEDHDASGALDGPEVSAEVIHRGVLDTEACPLKQALRPSFYVRDAASVGVPPLPDLQKVDGRDRGYSGGLAGDYAPKGNSYALKVQSANAGIHVNGGAMDEEDRDPDGPGANPAAFPLNPLAAGETAPLQPNGVPDHRDASLEGPNGFLVRLLDNLDAVVSNGETSSLGVEIVGARPVGGYKSLDDLPARAGPFKPYLTLQAWVDPKVVKPQPMDGRPFRWEDIDDSHRIGVPALEISGVRTVGGGTATLSPLISGSGTEASPWRQGITVLNLQEKAKTYPVTWERNFVYAWSQVRPSPPVMEPRAPVAMQAPKEVLASVFLGLRGAWLEAWDGAAGWDGGFGWSGGAATYAYPDQATEPTPWHRTRLDYGMTYGAGALPRPWYGPAAYDPALGTATGGKPVIQAAPLGRLRETPPIDRAQSLAVAERLLQAGRIRTWARFNAFVDGLPLWEDLDGDGILDGAPYTVTGSGGSYARRTYRREDLDSDGGMTRQAFPGGARGLTFVQKDLLKAMANPNTDLNCFNPDANFWKEVDKTGLAGISAVSSGYVHTTELAFQGAGDCFLRALGRVVSAGGRLLAQRQCAASVRPDGGLYRDTTQADFMRAYHPGGEGIGKVFEGPGAPYPLAGGQPLVSYPEPQTVQEEGRAASAGYDGQVSLGFIGPRAGPDETLRGSLFDARDATDSADAPDPDLRGPLHKPLLCPVLSPSASPAPPLLFGGGTGNVFPDGVYSEKDRSLKFRLAGNIQESGDFYIAFWAKPNWRPEASPRAHALIGLSRGVFARRMLGEEGHMGLMPANNAFDLPWGRVPLDDILACPGGLFFLPSRNSFSQETMGVYDHTAGSSRGGVWPCRALLWGSAHNLFASDCLNRRGILTRQGAWSPPESPLPLATHPVGRLEAHRWQHVAALGHIGWVHRGSVCHLILGRVQASMNGGGWASGFETSGEIRPIAPEHADGTPNHIRLGAVAGQHNMNYAADATFANVRAGSDPAGASHAPFFTGTAGPAALGRYLKEDGARFVSPRLPAEIRHARITWTEIPCDLWFDERSNTPSDPPPPDGWMDTLRQDENSNGKRDVRIDLEVWDDAGLLARFDDPGAHNRIPPAQGRLYYKAVFVNEWDPDTRANHPLDVTPFLDDVTITYTTASGLAILSWVTGEDG